MRRFIRNCPSILGAVAAYMLSGAASHAVSVNPLVLELEASGSKRASTFEVFNDSATPLPVELRISRLELDETGAQKNTPAPSAFSIIPPLATVKPGQSQKFRIQWSGTQPLDESQSYTISVSQVPVKFPTSQSGMQLVLNFTLIANVAPVNAGGSLDLVSAGFAKDQSGNAKPQIVVQNKGKRHASLAAATITLSNGKSTQTLTPEVLRQEIGVGLVQPGKKRRFFLPSNLQVGPFTARIEYQSTVSTITSN